MGVPVFNAVYAVGGPRLLLNLRASYFSPVQGTSQSADLYRSTMRADTVGTIGKLWSSGSENRGTLRGGRRMRSFDQHGGLVQPQRPPKWTAISSSDYHAEADSFQE
ncbi:hypothetical protein FRB90_012073 [Tulasnella sp. 427]|nr:hypothetical protein FRB90_012073 [Tulasnella sp. 427]